MDSEIEDQNKDLDGTFTLDTGGHDTDKDLDTKADENVIEETNDSMSLVTVVIEDKDKEGESEKGDKDEKTSGKKIEKQKTPKKKKFNVVKDFKKPNTTNVVSKLSEYLKTPVPVKPREDKNNTEEAKNKRNSMKGKIDVSKVTSKLNIKSLIDEPKKTNGESEKKESENGEKEKEKEAPKKIIKRTPPKSKWDAIMSKIEGSKETEKEKPKGEVKSKLEAFLHVPPPAPPKKEEPKPKRRISSALPDYSKVQSKLKYTAAPAPPKPKKDESPSRANTSRKSIDSPNRSKNESPNRSVTDSPKRKNNITKSASPSRAKTDQTKRQNSVKDSSPSRGKDNVERGRERRLSKIKNERVRSLSGDSSVKRPDIKDKAVHIDLGDSLDGRGSRVESGSLLSSCQSSRTDMSTTEEDLYQNGLHKRKLLFSI